MMCRFSLRANQEDADLIRHAYELFRREKVASGNKPDSLNQYLIGLVRERLIDVGPVGL